MTDLAGFQQAIQNLQSAAGGGSVGALPPADGMTPAQRFSAQDDDFRFANMDQRPEADPGMAWAEDGTQVRDDYWG